MPEWGIAIIAMLIGFLLNVFYENYKEKMRRRQANLNTHFNQELIGVLTRIGSFNGLTLRKEKNNTLEFGSGTGHFSEIKDEYYSKDDEIYTAFKVHFPDIAQKWEGLHKQSLELKNNLDKTKRLPHDEFEEVSNSLKQLSHEVKRKLEDIKKYQIGTVFKRDKKCPICKKF